MLKIITSLKAETYTFNEVKELLQMHEKTVLNVFNSTIYKLTKKIDILKEQNSKIKKELTDLGKVSNTTATMLMKLIKS